MKNIKQFSVLLGAVLILSFSSCKKEAIVKPVVSDYASLLFRDGVTIKVQTCHHGVQTFPDTYTGSKGNISMKMLMTFNDTLLTAKSVLEIACDSNR